MLIALTAALCIRFGFRHHSRENRLSLLNGIILPVAVVHLQLASEAHAPLLTFILHLYVHESISPGFAHDTINSVIISLNSYELNSSFTGQVPSCTPRRPRIPNTFNTFNPPRLLCLPPKEVRRPSDQASTMTNFSCRPVPSSA